MVSFFHRIVARAFLAGLWGGCLLCPPTFAATFPLPADNSTVVGNVHVVTSYKDNTLLDIGRHFDVGYAEMEQANPGMSVWTPHGRVVVPTEFILPPKPWTGIVINISQRRLYFFPKSVKGQPARVVTYPVGIAQEGWSTPLGATRIIAKFKDPAWFVPKSIQAQHTQEDGVKFPDYFPPGPDNPMGMLAMQTGFPGIFIHATNHPWGVGLRTSHGCLHLYPEDAAELFPLLKIGTPVRVIDQPVMVGMRAGHWVMAVFEPVKEYPNTPALGDRVDKALAALPLSPDLVARDRVAKLTTQPQPLPVELAADLPGRAQMLDAVPDEPYPFAPYGVDANNANLPVGLPSGAK
jgi:L,D-transpeptidase ErfK/SrfK